MTDIVIEVMKMTAEQVRACYRIKSSVRKKYKIYGFYGFLLSKSPYRKNCVFTLLQIGKQFSFMRQIGVF